MASLTRRPWVSFLLWVVGGYAAVCALMYLAQGTLLYFPTSRLDATPADLGLEYADVWFDAPDGTRVHAWYVPIRNARATVIWCHGNAGNISHRLGIVHGLHQLGLAVFIFDYRGYGQSGGSPGEATSYEDAELAWTYVTEKLGLPETKIIVWGRSLGGAVAVNLASRHHPKALIVESTFTSVPDLGQRLYPWLPVRLLSRFDYDSEVLVPGIKSTKLFVHSNNDEIIPYALGRKLFDAAAEPKRFVTIRGGHNSDYLAPASGYLEPLRFFLDEALGE